MVCASKAMHHNHSVPQSQKLDSFSPNGKILLTPYWISLSALLVRGRYRFRHGHLGKLHDPGHLGKLHDPGH